MLSNDWRNMKNGIKTEYYAYSSTNYTYTPNVLWGAAAGNHVDDIRDYGVWRPKYMDFVSPKDSFYVDDPNEIVFMGNGCAGGNSSSAHIIDATSHNANSIFNDLKTMADNINNGGFPSDKFYVATIKMRQSDYSQAYVDELSQLLDSLNSYISKNSSKMEWDFLSEKRQIWNTVFNKDTNQLSCGSSPTTQIDNLRSNNNNIVVDVFPNPSNGLFTVSVNHLFDNKDLELQVYDIIGNNIVSINNVQDKITLDLSKCKSGMYLCKIADINGLLAVEPLFVLNQ